MRALPIAAAIAVGSCAQAAPPASPACVITVPAAIRSGPARWLGACDGGKATGVGVLRVTTRPGPAFFFGRVEGGRPRTGLAMRGSGNVIEMRGVGPDGAVLPTDAENPREQDRAWADAAAGARSVAQRFAAEGNAGSSAYYARWAWKIETQRPE